MKKSSLLDVANLASWKLGSRNIQKEEENGICLYRNLHQNPKTSQDSSSKTRIPSNSMSNSSIQLLDDEYIGHPFTVETIAINNCIIASGNLNLQHLSLSFNRLTNKTLKNFMLCLYYQAYMLLGNSRKGLIYVFLEGNDIEKNEDWTKFQDLLYRRRQKDQTIEDIFEEEELFKELKREKSIILPSSSEILRKKISVMEFQTLQSES
ncbi:PREDICTED: uncharacterized protein LOC108684625 [Atta colombica]|uniref:uncharacterized protein LOC108684625 n=1 Tax=Atta colombica TaxID=520822 RepID=UPI00084BC643|nr:PREDICTED: uncharacterized protein LOC108684625 [Atta colombica]